VTISAFAQFDALYVTRGLAPVYDEVTEGEIHTLCYLAALLSVYAQRPAAWWRYDFHRVAPAAPFSEAVSEAIGFDVRVGLLRQHRGALSVTRRGARELELWEAVSLNQQRAPFLDAAVAAAIHLSLPIVTRAVQREPQVKRAVELSSERRLLTPLGLEALHEQLNAVAEVLKADDREFKPNAEPSILVVAVVWLDYLRHSERTDDGGDTSADVAA
jgi:hypothetical protein